MSGCEKGLDLIVYYDLKEDSIEIIWVNVCFFS